MARRHGLFAALAGATLLVSACGGADNTAAVDPEQVNAAPKGTESAEASGAVASGAGAEGATTGSDTAGSETADLNFTATTLEGSTFSGESLAGKPAVLWFWAPWCPTCRAQAPAVSDIAQQYDGQVAVVGVGGAAVASEIEEVARDIEGPIQLIDEPGEVWQHFKITAQSTYLIVDADGSVVTDGQFLSDDDLRATVADLAG